MPRTTLLPILAALAITALCAGGLAPAAAAAPTPQTYTVSGSIIVGPPPALVLPAGATVSFDLDPATGAITNGTSDIPPFERGGTGPQATFVLTDSQPFTGSIDPVTGEATISFSYDVEVRVSPTVVCYLAGPVAFTMTTGGAGGSALANGTAIVVAAGFTIPEVTTSATCAADVASLANALFGTPTNDTSATFTVTEVVPGRVPAPAT
jgi:hypothetical protein